jgi:hypothetical protein
MVIGTAGVPQAVPEALDMIPLGGLLVEAGNFSDLGEVAIQPASPHLRQKRAYSRRRWRGARRLWAKHAADGAVHPVLSAA